MERKDLRMDEVDGKKGKEMKITNNANNRESTMTSAVAIVLDGDADRLREMMTRFDYP